MSDLLQSEPKIKLLEVEGGGRHVPHSWRRHCQKCTRKCYLPKSHSIQGFNKPTPRLRAHPHSENASSPTTVDDDRVLMMMKREKTQLINHAEHRLTQMFQTPRHVRCPVQNIPPGSPRTALLATLLKCKKLPKLFLTLT